MRDVQHQEFGRRLNRISKHHAKLANGYVNVMNSDGLLVAQPRRTGLRFPWRALAVLAVFFFLFKSFLMAGLGETDYAERVISLQAGTPVEQFGGWAMQPDPITNWLATQIGAIL